MKKMLALVVARNKEFYRDRNAMVWTLVFPFVVLTGFTYGYSGRQDPLVRMTVLPASALHLAPIQKLQNTPGVELKTSDQKDEVLKKLGHYEVDYVISTDNDGKSYQTALNDESVKGKLGEQLFQSELKATPEVTNTRTVTTGKKIRYSDWLLPGLLSMNIMFGSMFGVGYVIVRYRKNGVLKRLRATPLSAFQFLSAQIISRVMLMLFTSWMVLGGAMLLIGFRPQGSWLDFSIFLCVSSGAMISLGVIVAARITTEEVADGILNLMTWPMIFLSGIWFSIDGASQWVLFLAKFMPLSHVVHGLRLILVEGAPLSQVMPEVYVLLALSAFFLALGSAIFRWR